MEVSVNGDALQAALAKAITDSITPEMQQRIIAKALEEHLFRRDQYNRTPITEAFSSALNSAVRHVAEIIVLKDPAVQTKIETALHEAVDEFLQEKDTKQKLLKKLVNGLGW